MTETMLEKMARAICDEDFDPDHPAYPTGPECMYYNEEEAREAYIEVNWRATLPLARAALEAIREPSDDILCAGLTIPRQAWEASIDAILSEGK